MITYRLGVRKKNRNRSFWRLALFTFISLSLIGIVFLNVRIFQKRKMLYQEIHVLEKRIDDLKNEKSFLLEKISEAESKDFLERAGYENFNLKKFKEEVVAFPRLNQTMNRTTSPVSKGEKESFWQKILRKAGLD